MPQLGNSKLPTEVIAAQVAHLLNLHNRLRTPYNAFKVLNSKTVYLPEVLGGLVFGSIGVQRVSFLLSEVKHLVVHPILRRAGLGRGLLKKAMATAITPLLFATIRADNEASIALFVSMGFHISATSTVSDYKVHLLLRENEPYRPPKASDRVQEDFSPTRSLAALAA